MLGNIAAVFHWPPSELWDLDLDDIALWHEQAMMRSGSEPCQR
ncbi:GpE family phage tail protein [Algicola sagamiensis]|nr:GpE family phage tail protein [Algicola sagamiensis]